MSSNRVSDIINSHTFLIRVIKNIETQIKRNLTDTEEDIVINYIKNVSCNYFNGISIDKIITILTSVVIEELHLNHCEENIIDMHEMLKDSLGDTVGQQIANQHNIKKEAGAIVEVNIESVFGLHDISTIVKKINEPISSVNNAYFLLDSRYRILGNDGTAFFKWGHINSLVRAQGTYNSIGDIRDIISIQIMPFRIPAVASAITPYNRITTFVHELCPQSYVAHEERRFHFIGDVKVKPGGWLEVSSHHYSHGEFKFNKPITHLDSMTITFATPLEPIVFDKDRLLGTITSYASPTVIQFPENHNLTTGDKVYITTFDTINPNADNTFIINMNNLSGLLATVTTPLEITVPVDTSSVITALSGYVTPPSVLLGGTVSASNNSNILNGIGTTFTTDFAVGDYIKIQDWNTNPIFQVSIIMNNTQLTLNNKYTYSTGTYTYHRTGKNIIGTGTLFLTELSLNDNIIIVDGADNSSFIVESIQDNTTLTISTPYDGTNGAGFTFSKNNSIDQTFSVFFGSKRIFLPIEITYLSASSS